MAMCSRYRALIEPGAARWIQSENCPASTEESVNHRYFPRPSNKKNTPMQMRVIVSPVPCLSIAIIVPHHLTNVELRPTPRLGRSRGPHLRQGYGEPP